MRKRSKYSLSHYHLLTANMGKLIPVMVAEAIPGDTWQHTAAQLIRVAPLAVPVMHPVLVRLNTFFVPYRLIWDDFDDFFTGGENGDEKPVLPYSNSPVVTEGSLWDYMGVPPHAYTYGLNILPFRAYHLIYNTYYRDDQIHTEANFSTASGQDSTTQWAIHNVSWPADYFTTCRPSSQLGSTVNIPIGNAAPVIPIASGDKTPTFDVGSLTNINLGVTGGTNNAIWGGSSATATNAKWNTTQLEADLSAATGMTVNDLRWALGSQRFKEMMNQGARYEDLLMASFGVKGMDARLQNPEYLGGGRTRISFSEVMATDGNNTGDQYGHGMSTMRTNTYRRFIQEHGLIMTLMSVVPKAIYSQALPKLFTKSVKEDFYTHALEFVGDMPVENREVYAMHSNPNNTFGYQRIYDDYRQLHSKISGEFRSTLSDWTMARIHTGDIALNPSFLNCSPTDRIYKSTATDQLYCMVNHSIQARRLPRRNPPARVI